jgi:proline dehydrogenase
MPWLNDRLIDVLTHVPKPIMRKLSSRYIAGETLEEALACLGDLAARGYKGMIDILGEDVLVEQQARAVLAEYKLAASAVAARKLDTYVSVKPTHLALKLSEELAFQLYLELGRHAAQHKLFMRVEMEDHHTTEATLRLFARLHRELDNVGIVIQARLLRTPDDIAKLPQGRLSVRMVKGIYLEPASIAHVDPAAISDAYVACCEALFERGAFISLATHDQRLADRLMALVARRGIAKDGYEFQVLLGVQEPLWELWRKAGSQVRVYVPYGPEWLPYSLRRLRKNPQLVGHVIKSTLRL